MTIAPKAVLKVELINVGHGDALLIHWTPDGGEASTVLIDGGPAIGGARIAETLGHVGAKAIDLAVLSHPDADHVDGLLAYALLKERLPIRRYWGPCLPAFQRHSWLFPARIGRGLDQAAALEHALEGECRISWPVDGATWTSPDSGLTIRVLSPAPRLIERLLLGHDALSLFMEHPTPLGWLFEEAAAVQPIEDPFADLRFALSTGEITPDRVPPNLPPSQREGTPEQYAEQAADHGVAPEFFGNSVLNDTSIVLLVEARLGVVTRRLLFTGDLENFTYLAGQHPMGLGCDVVKAPHHGSYCFIGREKAYDGVWQWLRPRVVLVSANGKHGLPRSDFRDAALRQGGTLFCTSRRSREIVTGVTSEPCCHVQYECARNKQGPVSLVLTDTTIESDGIACARGNNSGVIPVIEVRQHVVEPSAILTTLAETELRKHADWAVAWLRNTHNDRCTRPARSDLEPVPINTLRKAAAAERRLAAAAEIEVILERAAREGKVWLSRNSNYRNADRSTWAMPNVGDMQKIRSWIDQFHFLQVGVQAGGAASAPEEMLFAADTGWFANRAAVDLLYPRAMFDEALWPIIVSHLLRTRTVAVRTLSDDSSRRFGVATIVALFEASSLGDASASLAGHFGSDTFRDAVEVMEGWVEQLSSYQLDFHWPDGFIEVAPPLWAGKALPPSGLMVDSSSTPFALTGDLDDASRSAIEGWVASIGRHYGRGKPLPTELIAPTLSSWFLSGFEIVRRPQPRR